MSTEVPPPPPPADPAGGSTPGAAPQPPKLKLQPRAPGAPAAAIPPPPGAPLPPPPAPSSIPRPPSPAPAAGAAAKLSPTTGPVVAPADPTWIVAIDVLAALTSLGCAVFLAIEIFSKTHA